MSKAIGTKEAQEFLEQAARYFQKRPTKGEDAAHWSNVANSENCRSIADLIERQRIALDSAMMVVWWAVSEGFAPIGYHVDPDQVMIDNVQTITRDDGVHWEQMFQALSQ